MGARLHLAALGAEALSLGALPAAHAGVGGLFLAAAAAAAAGGGTRGGPAAPAGRGHALFDALFGVAFGKAGLGSSLGGSGMRHAVDSTLYLNAKIC